MVSNKDEIDAAVTDAGDILVVSIVTLVAGLFAFSISAIFIKIITEAGHASVSGDFMAVSGAILAAAVLISAAKTASR